MKKKELTKRQAKAERAAARLRVEHQGRLPELDRDCERWAEQEWSACTNCRAPVFAFARESTPAVGYCTSCFAEHPLSLRVSTLSDVVAGEADPVVEAYRKQGVSDWVSEYFAESPEGEVASLVLSPWDLVEETHHMMTHDDPDGDWGSLPPWQTVDWRAVAHAVEASRAKGQ